MSGFLTDVDLFCEPYRTEREERLGIKRFGALPLHFYDTVYDHSVRVAALVYGTREIWRPLFPGVELNDVVVQGHIHDDEEQHEPLGDRTTNVVEAMDGEQRKAHDVLVEEAMETVGGWYPYEILGMMYEERMRRHHRKDEFVSQYICYLDKIDAYVHAVREGASGNRGFHRQREGDPIKSYGRKFSRRDEKWPLLKPLFEDGHPLFSPLPDLSLDGLVTGQIGLEKIAFYQHAMRIFADNPDNRVQQWAA